MVSHKLILSTLLIIIIGNSFSEIEKNSDKINNPNTDSQKTFNNNKFLKYFSKYIDRLKSSSLQKLKRRELSLNPGTYDVIKDLSSLQLIYGSSVLDDNKFITAGTNLKIYEKNGSTYDLLPDNIDVSTSYRGVFAFSSTLIFASHWNGSTAMMIRVFKKTTGLFSLIQTLNYNIGPSHVFLKFGDYVATNNYKTASATANIMIFFKGADDLLTLTQTITFANKLHFMTKFREDYIFAIQNIAPYIKIYKGVSGTFSLIQDIGIDVSPNESYHVKSISYDRVVTGHLNGQLRIWGFNSNTERFSLLSTVINQSIAVYSLFGLNDYKFISSVAGVNQNLTIWLRQGNTYIKESELSNLGTNLVFNINSNDNDLLIGTDTSPAKSVIRTYTCPVTSIPYVEVKNHICYYCESTKVMGK